MYPVFPVNVGRDGRKIPLIKGWQGKATGDPRQHDEWRAEFGARITHWGIPTGQASGLLVLDADVKGGGLETIKRLALPRTGWQRTLSGGLHFLFRYPDDGKRYGNPVKFMPGLDARGEGGYVVHYGFDLTHGIAPAPPWLLEACAVAESAPPAAVPSVRVAPEIAQAILSESLEAIREAASGESNNVLNVESFRIGQLVAAESLSREDAEAQLLAAASWRGKPLQEAKATIRSGLDGGIAKPILSPFAEPPAFPLPSPPEEPRWTPRRLTRQDLMNASHLRKPQLFQHWSTEDITLTTADGGTGKTTLKLFEAVCLALGERFLGFDCKQRGKTLFITGEDTDKKLAAMLGQITRQMALCDDQVEAVMNSIAIKKDADLCLIAKDRHGFLHPNGEALRKVLQGVEDLEPKMIVFDPIASFWGSESALNDMNKAVSKFMGELVERAQACVEMINHMGKSSSANKDMTQFAGRGGSGLPSNARVSRVLRPVLENEYEAFTGETLGEKQSAMLCNVNKFTDGSPLYNREFLIVRDGYLFSRKDVSKAKAEAAEKALTLEERVFLFIREQRANDRYPTQKLCLAHFRASREKISENRVKHALTMLEYAGHMGEKIKLVENPDVAVKDRVYVITDLDGREI
jgi:hypothetical protein